MRLIALFSAYAALFRSFTHAGCPDSANAVDCCRSCCQEAASLDLSGFDAESCETDGCNVATNCLADNSCKLGQSFLTDTAFLFSDQGFFCCSVGGEVESGVSATQALNRCNPPSSSDDGPSGGVVAFLVILFLSMFVVLIYFVTKYKKESSDTKIDATGAPPDRNQGGQKQQNKMFAPAPSEHSEGPLNVKELESSSANGDTKPVFFSFKKSKKEKADDSNDNINIPHYTNQAVPAKSPQELEAEAEAKAERARELLEGKPEDNQIQHYANPNKKNSVDDSRKGSLLMSMKDAGKTLRESARGLFKKEESGKISKKSNKTEEESSDSKEAAVDL